MLLSECTRRFLKCISGFRILVQSKNRNAMNLGFKGLGFLSDSGRPEKVPTGTGLIWAWGHTNTMGLNVDVGHCTRRN